MKKLMIMLGAIACAIGVQAATVSWALTGVNSGDSGVNGYAYVFSNKTGTYTSPEALKAALASITTASAMQKFMDDNSLTALNAAVTGGSADVSGVDLEDSGLPAATSGTRLFAVVFNTATITDDSAYYVTTTSSGVKTPGASTTNNAKFTIASQASATSGSGAWTAVPEPTSGLLLLLGMAGLALKRKRA